MAGTVHTLENHQLVEQVERESAQAARQLAEAAHLRRGQIVVIGCSTSEVVGHQGGQLVHAGGGGRYFPGAPQRIRPHGRLHGRPVREHLNRALIVEHEAVPGAEIVNVVPQPKAGSSFATAAYRAFRHPVALEEIRADAGLDIGGTLIGMHLKKVAVPVRLEQNHIGQAILLAPAPGPSSSAVTGLFTTRP